MQSNAVHSIKCTEKSCCANTHFSVAPSKARFDCCPPANRKEECSEILARATIHSIEHSYSFNKYKQTNIVMS